MMRQNQQLTREKNQLMGENQQLMRKEAELQTANTRGQKEVQQLRQQVSDTNIIV